MSKHPCRTRWPIPLDLARAAKLATPRPANLHLTKCMPSNLCNAVAGAILLGWGTCLLAPAAPSDAPGFAGSETCKACHEEIFNKFSKSPHFVVENDSHRGWAKQSCESCHGPGAKHAES